jgi:hypothetical protein
MPGSREHIRLERGRLCNIIGKGLLVVCQEARNKARNPCFGVIAKRKANHNVLGGSFCSTMYGGEHSWWCSRRQEQGYVLRGTLAKVSTFILGVAFDTGSQQPSFSNLGTEVS